MSEIVLKKKGKSKVKKWIILGVTLLMIIGLLFLAFYMLMINPKYVISQSVVKTFSKINSSSTDTTNGMQFGVSAKASGNVLDSVVADDTFNFRGFINEDNTKVQLTGNISEDGKKILDGSVLYDNDSIFVASDNLLDYVYNLDNYDCEGKDDFICSIIKVQDNSDDLGIKKDDTSIEDALRSLEDAILNNINKDNTFRNKGTFKEELNDYNKYTFKLDKDTVTNIYNQLNDAAKYYLYDVTLLFSEDYNYLSETKKVIEDKINNINDTLEINIYTSGLFNKFEGIEIGNSSTFLNFSYVRDNGKLNFSLPDAKVRVESTINDKLSASIYYNNILLGTVNSEQKDDVFTLDTKIDFLGMALNIRITNKISTNTDDELAGLLNVSVNFDTFITSANLNFEFDYNASTNITMKQLNTDDAKDYSNISQEEKDKLETEMNNFYKTKFGSIFTIFDEDMQDELLNTTM